VTQPNRPSSFPGRGKFAPWGDKLIQPNGRAVEHIPADEDGVGSQGSEACNDTAKKC
jgi:hypothetical protein